jgi:hypothetical protein
VPSLRTLDPAFRPAAAALLRVARSRDNRFRITSARRSRTEQARLYARWQQGLSPFPALPPGRSQHERGLAVDLARFGVPAENDPLLRALGASWRAAGGVWGGEADPVHFEAPKSWTGRS